MMHQILGNMILRRMYSIHIHIVINIDVFVFRKDDANARNDVKFD